MIRIKLQTCVMEDDALISHQVLSNEEVGLEPPSHWRMILRSFCDWASTEETTGGINKIEHLCSRLRHLPPPTFLLPSFHSSCHFSDVLILGLEAEPFEKVWHLWSTFSHRSCNFGCIFYVFQIQVNLKVPASQVTLTLRTSQKMVSLAWDSGCCTRVHRSQQPRLPYEHSQQELWGFKEKTQEAS